jgi:thiol:disulfide interchange protein DsbA
LKKLLLAIALFGLLPLAACAEEETYVEGIHYEPVSPALRARDPDKIEVLEFFWYGCGHCYNFEPLLVQWKKSLPDDVDFVASPAMWNGPMGLHAQAFYTAQALDVLEPLHNALFAAMNVDKKRLASEQEIGQVFVANGVANDAFSGTFSSFGVNSQVRQADARARSARITGTPEMVVAGKYRVSTRQAGSQAVMLKIADFLIEKERAALSRAALGRATSSN